MIDLPEKLVGLQSAIGRGECSATEALQAQRQRLGQRSPALHCVVQAFPEADDTGSGVLAGIGLAHKDIFDLANRRPGVGHDHGGVVPGLQPAKALVQLARHGAGNLAALTMAEYACGATAENPFFERCVNPLRAAAVVGGSSSGSAVAVAAQIAYGSLGTDTAGSIRIPAATCALVGLKATHGMVACDGVFPLAPSLDSVGILTRCAADAQQLLDALAPCARSSSAAGRPLRVKAWIPGSGLQDEIAGALEAFLDECHVACRIDEWHDHQTLTRRAETVLYAEAGQTHRAALLEGTASTAVRDVALAGLVLPQNWYTTALAERARHARAFVSEHLESNELFLLPALPDPVPDWPVVSPRAATFDARKLLGLHRYMSFVNYLGLPALVMPIARDSRGMPISVQLVARPFHEHSLLAFAHSVELRLFGRSGCALASFSGD